MSQQWIPKKPNFGTPPPGYISGIGRGAIGFVTRSDIGPANMAANIKKVQLDDATYADSKYDSWGGYNAPLFGKEGLDDQDKQAEDAYDFCQRKMDQRRLKQRQQNLQKQKELIKKQNVSFKDQFADLKRQLRKISYEEWESIPEAVDSSIKKQKREKYTPVPDSMIVSLVTDNMNKSIGPETNKDFRDAKEILLKTRLENAENTVFGQSNIDRIGYLTELSNKKVQGDFLGDVKRARVLLKSALNSNPKNSDLWVSAARVQQLDGKLVDARELLKKGLENCPHNQDLWIETARMERPQNVSSVLVQGLKVLPMSEKIWMAAARQQSRNKEMKSKILRKGLQNIPQSVKLWKQLIELQDLQEAKKLLYKAVQCLPKQIDLWLALAKMQNYENAKIVINKARKANPLNASIWINAAKLQQTQQEDKELVKDKIEKILSKGREILQKNGNTVTRQQWIGQALLCQRSNNLLTCEALIKISITLGLAEEEFENVFIKDTQLFQKERQSVYVTRFLYKYGVIASKNKYLLQKMIQLERRLQLDSKNSDISGAIALGIKMFGNDSQFWCMMIEKFINQQNYDDANKIIEQASLSLQEEQRQDVLVKKIEILKIQGKYLQTRMELEILRKMYNSQKCLIESIKYEYQMKAYQKAWQLCETAFKTYKSQQIFLLAFKVQQRVGTYQQCKTLIEKGLKIFNFSLHLWLSNISFQIHHNHLKKARATINDALIKIPNSQELHLQRVQFQLKYGTPKQTNNVLAKALQACPKSGQLWGYAIQLQPVHSRKKKAAVAIQNCPENNYILCAVAKTFWKQNKLEKAKRWLENAVQLQLTNGDIWAYFLKFMTEKFPEERQMVVKKFRSIGKITSGRQWHMIRSSENGWLMTNQEVLQKLVQNTENQLSNIN